MTVLPVSRNRRTTPRTTGRVSSERLLQYSTYLDQLGTSFLLGPSFSRVKIDIVLRTPILYFRLIVKLYTKLDFVV